MHVVPRKQQKIKEPTTRETLKESDSRARIKKSTKLFVSKGLIIISTRTDGTLEYSKRFNMYVI